MKLEKFNNKKKIIIKSFIFVVVSIIGMVIFRSYALYKDEKETNIANEDVKLAFTINGEKRNEAFPSKTSGYEVSSVICKNGVTASWNQEKWGLSNIESNGNPKIQCSIDFSIPKVLLVNYLKNLNSSELVDDGTTDHNLRYIGKNPNNYVSFNGELWRIIGVMNDVADDKGVVEPRVKLIRSESIGSYAWDNKGSGSGTSNIGNNDWSVSALKEVLNNGAYYNRTSGSCPSGRNGATKACDFSNTGLTSDAKSMIDSVIWKLGAINKSSKLLTNQFYDFERGTTVYEGRPTEWTGSIGLIYPSDYGYATAGGDTLNRSECLNTDLFNWGSTSSYSDCKNNDWLYIISNKVSWMLSSSSLNSYGVFDFVLGGVSYASPDCFYNVYPTVYLKPNINIKDGTGTSENPFILEG